MGKYWGYLLLIGGLIFIAAKLYSLFYFSNLYNTMPNCAYNDFECLQMRHYVGHQMLRSMVWAFFGLIITYWGWKDIQKNKTINNIADQVSSNVVQVVKKYATPSGPKFNSVEEIDQYLENLKNEDDLEFQIR